MKKKWLVFGAVVVISLVSIGALAGAAESGTPFSDVPAGYWATSAIQSAVSKGYVSGYPDGTFKPDREVSRAEFVKMLADALDLPRSRGGSPWYQPYAAALLDEGVLVESDFSDYQAPISRLEIMRLVSRGLARDERYGEYLEAFSGLYNGDLPYVDYRELEEADVPYAALASAPAFWAAIRM
jgi:S-layer homology domain.